MHTEMWEHPATAGQRRDAAPRGAIVLDPPSAGSPAPTPARAGCPSPAEICAVAARGAAPGRASDAADLAGRRVVVTAGGTREPLDPVRYLGNRSSGRQGFALARDRRPRGAPGHAGRGERRAARPGRRRAGARRQHRGAARRPCSTRAADADVVVMAAAPADFRPAERRGRQDQEGAGDDAPLLRLVRNPDVLAELGAAQRARPGARRRSPPRPATTPATSLAHARAKLARKGCDLLVVNEVGGDRASGRPQRGRPSSPPSGGDRRGAAGTKEDVADAVWDVVAALPAIRPGYGSRAVALTPSLSLCRAAVSCRSAVRCDRERRGPPSVHVRVRHRGPPGQDR